MPRASFWWPAAIALSALSIGVVAFGGLVSPLRPWIALWFLGICPGMALVRLLRIGDGVLELTLAVALSLALDLLVAVVALYAGVWSPNGVLAILIAVSLGGVAVQLAQARASAIGHSEVRR